MLASSTDQYQQPNSFSVDTDGVYFIINNSANGGICNNKFMFAGDFERHRVTLVTAYGRTTTKKLVGTIPLVLKDDKGKPWSYDIPDIQNHHIAYEAFLSLANTFLEMMKMNKNGYILHQHHPFSNLTMANINGILNMETLFCQKY